MTFQALLLSLLAASLTHATHLGKRAALDTCLQQSDIPTDTLGSTAWKADVLPYNARLPYAPVAVAVPTTIAQVQASVNCGRSAAIKTNPKCRGHSYASLGLGGDDGHFIIQLDNIYNVTLDTTTNIATIQAGARLGHVANSLWTQGKRAISAGTCPGVGVSGHAIHGGYGMSSHKHGLAVDAKAARTVVLANGTITNCSATQNSDLFWALRGAGSNFGVVVPYEFTTFAPPSTVTYFNMNFKWNINNASAN
ncbi:hypothetical protein LTR86_004546 [Recurvomyces mirabilis]|nr:hypothetical protein LTR86_004546 [Recurvomyces mirabilis]